MERYALLVLSVCMKYLKDESLAKDLTMQVFENLFVDLKKHQISNFRPWLYTVAKNSCLLYLRKDKRSNEKLEQYKKDTALVMEKELFMYPDEDAKEQLLLKLEACLTKLNSEQRIAIDLFFLQNKSYYEVAEITGYNLNEVKSYIQNGKRNLKQCITTNDEA